jgi:hypothetical protein
MTSSAVAGSQESPGSGQKETTVCSRQQNLNAEGEVRTQNITLCYPSLPASHEVLFREFEAYMLAIAIRYEKK